MNNSHVLKCLIKISMFLSLSTLFFLFFFFLSLWGMARIVINSLYMVIFELYCPHGCITKTIKKRVHNKCFQIAWWEYRGLWFYVVLRQAGILFLQHDVDRHYLLYVIGGGSMEYEYWSRLVHLLDKAFLLLKHVKSWCHLITFCEVVGRLVKRNHLLKVTCRFLRLLPLFFLLNS